MHLWKTKEILINSEKTCSLYSQRNLSKKVHWLRKQSLSKSMYFLCWHFYQTKCKEKSHKEAAQRNTVNVTTWINSAFLLFGLKNKYRESNSRTETPKRQDSWVAIEAELTNSAKFIKSAEDRRKWRSHSLTADIKHQTKGFVYWMCRIKMTKSKPKTQDFCF